MKHRLAQFCHRQLQQCQREEGQVLIWLLLLLPLLLLLTFMLYEGGLMYRTYRIAQMAADAGAHAAAQDIDVAHYQATGQLRLTPQAAGVAQYYASRNARGPITCTAPTIWATQVELHCQATLPSFFLAGQSIQVQVRGRARPAWGATQEQQ